MTIMLQAFLNAGITKFSVNLESSCPILVPNKKDEEPFEIQESQKSQPGEGYDRYATKMLYRSQDRKYWTDDDNFHKYVMDDYGFLKYVGYQ